MTRAILPLLAVALAGCGAASLQPEAPGLPLANAGFEQPGAASPCPPGWFCVSHAAAHSHEYRFDARAPGGGRQSLCADPIDPVNNWALVYQMVPAERLRGARVRFSVAVRAAKDPGTGAGPFLLVQGMDGGTVVHDQKLLKDSAGWRRVTTELVVPPGAYQLQVGVLFESHAPACADDARLEMVAPPPGAV